MKQADNYKIIILIHLVAMLIAAVLYGTGLADGAIMKIVFAVLFFSFLLQVLAHRFKPGWYADKTGRHPQNNN